MHKEFLLSLSLLFLGHSLFSQFIGLDGVGTNFLNLTNYGNINDDQIKPFPTSVSSVDIYQQIYLSGVTESAGQGIDNATLYYKANSSTVNDINGTSWMTVVGSFEQQVGSNDEFKFTISASAGSTFMYYIRYEESGTSYYGFPGSSSPHTTQPANQGETYKIHFNATTTYNTKLIDGNMYEWEAEEKLEDGAYDFYASWDETYLYFGLDGVNFTEMNQWHRWQIGINTDNNLGANGTNRSYDDVTYTNNEPEYLIIIYDQSGTTQFLLRYWDGAAWQNLSNNGSEFLRKGSTGFSEIRILRSDLSGAGAVSPSDNMSLMSCVDNVVTNTVWLRFPDENTAGNDMKYTWWYDATGTGVNPSAAQAALPVDFVRFKGSLDDTKIALSWETVFESQNSHFEIQKSLDNRYWSEIGQVKGQGSSTENQEYLFVDKNPAQGLNYYRLKQVDFDGNYEYSNVISVDYRNGQSTKIFPNPIKDELNIQFDNELESAANIQIFNAAGVVVSSENLPEFTKNYQINVNDIQPGLYWLEIRTDEGRVISTHKFVKE
jgi:hypothetical protein